MTEMRLGQAAIVFAVLSAAGCGPSPGASDGRLSVFVSIAPQKQFVERIAGDLVDVTVMVDAGSDPHTYEPRPAQMTALQNASAYFTIGVPFEDVWMERMAACNPAMRVVDSAEGIVRVVRGGAPDDGHEHLEGAPDPHIWLAPGLVKVQAGNICRALQEMDPDNSDVYAGNLAEFSAELDLLSSEIRARLEAAGITEFMVFHPAWGYFADEFGLEMITVEQGGQEPSPSELAATIGIARERGIAAVFAQPEFSTDAADVIARETGASVVLVSPLSEDWVGGMLLVTEALAGGSLE